MRATYSYACEQGVHVLTDENGSVTLLSEIEHVIADLHRNGADLTLPVIAADSLGYFERVIVKDGEFFSLMALDTKDRAQAIRTVQSILSLSDKSGSIV
jgi:hypothetical protein